MSVPVASIVSVKILSCPGRQGGAVSFTEYEQVSPGVPFGCSVVTGLPPTVQGTGVAVPPWGVSVTARPVIVKAGSRFWTVPVHA